MKGHSILSAGIDIGTTTTHVTLSRLGLSNTSVANRAPRMDISDRQIVYHGKIHFTPLTADGTIDSLAIAEIVRSEYAAAGVEPKEVSTGAVIITGESAQCRNAKEVSSAIAEFAGDFVVASAGAHLESVLAGRGSGAAKASELELKTICNVDIGGGTTNAAVFSNGRLIDTACLNLGGRCLRFDPSGVLQSMSDDGHDFLNALGKMVKLGKPVEPEMVERIGMLLGETIAHFIKDQRPPQVVQRMLETDQLRQDYKIDEYWFSGGVAEMMLAPEPNDFAYGDIGPSFARGLVGSLKDRELTFHIPPAPIRATVIGAGMHSLQLSGSTITVSDLQLPLRNVPIVRPFTGCEMPASEQFESDVRRQIERALKMNDLDWNKQVIAICIGPIAELGFAALDRWAQSLSSTFIALEAQPPLVVVCSQDIAAALGQLIKTHLPGQSLLVIDDIQSARGDFIDIGKPLNSYEALPVVIKDLVFAN